MSLGFGFSLPAYNGYAAAFGSGATLALDFTNGNNTLSPLITFSRTTNATVTGSNGLIQFAPMNLLTFSEQFDNAAWAKNTGGVASAPVVTANAAVAPNGTQTADRVVFNKGAGTTASDLSIIQQATSSITGVGSVYARADAPVTIMMRAGSTFVALNVTTSWQRFTTPFESASSLQIGLRPGYDITIPDSATVYLWGAQLESNATATTYNPTTVKNLLGFTENFDNAAWTKSNAFVQTNLLTNSEAFDNAAWSKILCTVVANDTVSPDGTTNADKVTDNSGSGTEVSQTVTVTSGATVAHSRYFKYIDSRWVRLVIGDATNFVRGWFDIQNGVVGGTAIGGTGASAAVSIVPAGNGWYRCTLVGALASVTSYQNISMTAAGNNDTARVNGGSYHIWGAQLVQGTTPGDYKATYAAAAAVGYTDIYGQPFAQKLVENTAASIQHRLDITPVSSAVPQTFSVYAKAAERNFMGLRIGSIGASFDLLDGTFGNVVAGVSAAITNVGSGWYRCSVTVAAPTANDTCRINLATTLSTAQAYTGDGTSGIFIFGAQLSDSASVDPYVYQPVAAPASTAYYGPRFDYDPVTLQPKGLLIEEQRTQLLLNSSLAGTSLATQNVTVTAVAHTLSFYGTGTVTLSGTSTAGPLVGTGAYPARSTLTFTPTAGTLTLTVTGTVQFAQLEIGAFATSFIPSAASQVTRAADSASMIGNNFARWYNQNAYTVFAEYIFAGDTTGVVSTIDLGQVLASGSDFSALPFTAAGGGSIQPTIRSGGVVQAFSVFGVVVGATAKTAYAVTTNSFNASNNGTLGTEDTSVTMPALPSTLTFGLSYNYGSGTLWLKRFAYYNRRLANTELTALTS